MNPSIQRRGALAALLLLVPAASIGTWAGMSANGSVPATWGRIAFVLAKLWLLGLPVLWAWRVDGQKPLVPRPRSTGMTAAGVTGLLMVLVIAGSYATLGRHWIDIPAMRQ